MPKETEAPILIQCAWCRRIKIRVLPLPGPICVDGEANDYRWAQPDPNGGDASQVSTRITHGICEACDNAMKEPVDKEPKKP